MERMKKFIFAISLFLFSTTSYAEYNRFWLELSAGFAYGETLKLKVRDDDMGWALIHSKYDESKFLGAADYDRKTLEKL